MKVRAPMSRSASMERDAESLLDEYMPTARSFDVLQRWLLAMEGSARGRAWSITGPYGSGKSSLGLLLAALAGPPGDVRKSAESIVARVDPDLAGALALARSALGADNGMLRVIVTADREPVVRTLARGLLDAIEKMWPGGTLPPVLLEVHERLRSELTATALADEIRRLAAQVPVLIILDEFGKNLEYLAERRIVGDAHVLQLAAEAGAGRNPLPVFLFVLQHLSMADYLGTLDESQRREWAKIQGRFEEIPYATSRDETIALVQAAIEHSSDPEFVASLATWAEVTKETLSSLGMGDMVPQADAIQGSYPLHPLALFALPELCARYGQSERSLFGFLAGSEHATVGEFLADHDLSEPLPVVSLGVVYDYFVRSARWLGAHSGRWMEIEARIDSASDLTPVEVQALKSVGVLNLVGSGGSLRASKTLVAYAIGRPDFCPDASSSGGILDDLVTRGYLTYRRFADEYRVWQGTDFDLDAAVDRAKQGLRAGSVTQIAMRAVQPQPIVALRHLQERGVYRVFESVFADGSHPITVPADRDGIFAYWVGAGSPAELSVSGGPSLVVESSQQGAFNDACLEAAATLEVLSGEAGAAADWVARRELTERSAEAMSLARRLFMRAYDTEKPWTSVMAQSGPATIAPGRWSRLVSDLCDELYRDGPPIHNEMLGRDSITRQAARARNQLMEAILLGAAQPHLGLEGYGPERALYEAILVAGEFHGPDQGEWRLRYPSDQSPFAKAFHALSNYIDRSTEGITVAEILDYLARPPFGLPRSVTPILLTVLLALREADLAIYQEGTYQAVLTPDVLERMTKIPDRFRIRPVVTDTGRAQVLSALGDALHLEWRRPGSRHRNASVLFVAAGLLRTVRDLPPYATATRTVGIAAVRVREALMQTREPDRLLFEELPVAVGVDPFSDGLDTEGTARAYSDAVVGALRELSRAYRELLNRLAGELAGELGLPGSVQSLRAETRLRVGPLVARIYEPRLRAFANALVDEGLDDLDWLAAVALAVTTRPPQSWRDEDEGRFTLELRRLVRSLRSAETLSFELLGRAGEAAHARRVTVTAPDGTETSEVVWLDDSVVANLRSKLRRFLEDAESTVGGNATGALLSLLIEQRDSDRLSLEKPSSDAPTKERR